MAPRFTSGERKILHNIKSLKIYAFFFYKKPVKGHSTESFVFGFLNFHIASRITLKAVLTSFTKHLLLTLFLANRDLLMGRIKKGKQTIIQLKKSNVFLKKLTNGK